MLSLELTYNKCAGAAGSLELVDGSAAISVDRLTSFHICRLQILPVFPMSKFLHISNIRCILYCTNCLNNRN